MSNLTVFFGRRLALTNLMECSKPNQIMGAMLVIRKRKVEDYMKTIYFLQERGVVRGAYIAKELNVTKPTVSVSLKLLQEEGYLEMKQDHSVVLTEKGMRIAREIADRHNSLFELLAGLGVNRKTAAQDACSIEHVISKESFQALCSLCEQKKQRK